LHACRSDWGTFGESADQLVEELLGADLEVEGVAAILDADVEELGLSMLVVGMLRAELEKE